MPDANAKPDALVNVECLCNPDVHIGDGRVLMGPQREGTIVVVAGQVTALTREQADLLIGRGQVRETERPATVFIEDSSEYKVGLAEKAKAEQRAAAIALNLRV